MKREQGASPAQDAANNTESASLLDGLIVEGSRGQYRVETAAGALLCTIRGRLRKELAYGRGDEGRRGVRRVKVKAHDPVTVGDRVRVLPTGGGLGVIEAVLAGGSAISRRDPDKGGGTLRSVAGIDQLVAVFAAREPEPHLGLLDRFLVLAESEEITALVCINKADLGIAPPLAVRLDLYARLGYPVVRCSAAHGDGIDRLRTRLAGHVSAFVGASGVGKSSLLNAVEPGLGLRVSSVSGVTNKGMHTTTGTRLVPLGGPAGGYIADTAGIRAFALDGAGIERLDWCFPEFRPSLGRCPHADCTHRHEPACAVREALAAGAVDDQRYRSYLRLYAEGVGSVT